MQFEIIDEIKGTETIAIGSHIRILAVLQRRYGAGRWRKLKGVTTVRLLERLHPNRRGALV